MTTMTTMAMATEKAINPQAAFEAIQRRATEMLEERVQARMAAEATSSAAFRTLAVGTNQDFKIKRAAVERARLRESRAAFAAANALLRAAR